MSDNPNLPPLPGGVHHPAPPLPPTVLPAPPVAPGAPAPGPVWQPPAQVAPTPVYADGARQAWAPPAPDPNNDSKRNAVPWIVGLAVLIVGAGIGLFVLLGRGGEESVAREAASVSPEADAPETSSSDEPQAEDQPEANPTTPPGFIGDPIQPDSVAVDATSVWVSDAACGVVVKVDKATEEVVGSVVVGDSASGVAVAAGAVWVGTRDQGAVVRVNPDELVVAGTVPVPGFALGLSARGNDVWTTDSTFGQVVSRINPATGRAQEFEVGGLPLHVEVGGGSAWVTNSVDGTVSRLDERTGQVEAVIEVGAWPHALAYANGAVWVGTETGSFWRIDEATNDAERIEDVDFSTIDTVVDGDDIWIADSVGGSVVRFDTGTGELGVEIDLLEFGDCQTFRENEGPPAPELREPSL